MFKTLHRTFSSLKMPVEVTLIRHGETEYNVKGLVHTHTVEGSLTANGIQQAELAGRALKEIKFVKAFSSPMNRTQETGINILNQSVHPTQKLIIDKRLTERSYGELLEGTSSAELLKLAKSVIPERPIRYAPEEGESFENVLLRIDSFFQELCAYADEVEATSDSDENKNVLVVTHGLWILIFFQYLHHPKYKYDVSNFPLEYFKLHPANTATTKFRIHGKSASGQRKIEFISIQKTCHLNNSNVDK